MVDQDHSSLQKIKEKLEKLKYQPETLKKVSTFLENKDNANWLPILESVIERDLVFQRLVDRLLAEKIDNLKAEEETEEPNWDRRKAEGKNIFVSDYIKDPDLKGLKNDDGSNICVSDFIEESKNVSQSWFSIETATRLSGEIGGALIGTALLPGLGTVFGGILGGKLTTSVAGMF